MNLEERVAILEARVMELEALVERMQTKSNDKLVLLAGDELVTVKQACEEFNIPPHLIYEARSNGLLNYERRGKNYLFKRTVLKEWLERMQEPKELIINVNEQVAKYLQDHPMRG